MDKDKAVDKADPATTCGLFSWRPGNLGFHMPANFMSIVCVLYYLEIKAKNILRILLIFGFQRLGEINSPTFEPTKVGTYLLG
jgi:hypothetical protein